MASRFELFTKFSIFKGLSVDDLFSLLTKVSLDFENYGMGESILKKDSESRGLVFLLDGKVELQEGLDSKIIEEQSLLVYTHIFGNHPKAPVQINAASDCSIMYIDPRSMLQMLRSNEIVLKNYLDLLSNKID